MKKYIFLLAIVSLSVVFAKEVEPFFFNIAPFSPGREKIVAADMKEYVARTGNRKVLYSMTLHPEGRPAMKKVDTVLESYRTLKKELEGSDVELGVLLQAIIGHWPRTDKKIEPWQRTVDITGNEVRFCALGKEYREYIREVARRIALEKPSYVLGDDDIRAFSPCAECFCPLHVAEFNRRRGTNHTSDSMREAVKNSKIGDPDYETFMALQRELVDGVCALIREGINSVDPSIPAGTCMSFWEPRFNHTASKAIANKTQETLLRFGNGNYLEKYKGANAEISNILKTQAYYAFCRDKVDVIIAEADTYPHNLWSRSSTSFNTHLIRCMFLGLKGAKLWLVNAHKGTEEVNRNYTDVMAENKGLYRTLIKTMEGSTPIGLIEPCLTNFKSWHFSKGGGEDFISPGRWSDVIFGRIGVPFCCEREYSKDGIWLLSGGTWLNRLNDDDLKAMLSRKVLIDGNAAVELTRRGFGKYIGVEAKMDEKLMFTFEEYADSELRCGLTKVDKIPRLEPRPGVKILSYLSYSPFSGSDEIERVAPGATLFKNELGGKVVVMAFHIKIERQRRFGMRRKEWLERVIEALDEKKEIPVVQNAQDVTLLAARAKDSSLLLCVTNENYDPLKTIKVKVGKISSAEVLQGDGTWKKVDFKRDGQIVSISHTVPCAQCAIIRIVQ